LTLRLLGVRINLLESLEEKESREKSEKVPLSFSQFSFFFIYLFIYLFI